MICNRHDPENRHLRCRRPRWPDGRRSGARRARRVPTLAANELRDLETTHRIVGGALVAVDPADDAEARLKELRIATLLRIDVAAGEVRQRYLSSIPGQDGIYARKAHEASLVLADQAIPQDRVPYVAVEAALDGTSLSAAAATIAAAAQRWTDASVAIEARRLAAKQAVRSARFPIGEL